MLNVNGNMIDKTKFFLGKQKLGGFQLFQSRTEFQEPKIEYIWSRDPDYIRQYMKVIDRYFDTELNLKDIYKKIDSKDLYSHFYLVLRNNQVIGGARLSISNSFSEYTLPAEKWGIFKYSDVFNDLDLRNNSCAEVGRYAFMPEYRNDPNHYMNAFRDFQIKMTENKTKYLFLCGSRAMLRIHHRVAKNYFKLVDTRHVDVSTWDDFKHLEFYVSAYENEGVK